MSTQMYLCRCDWVQGFFEPGWISRECKVLAVKHRGESVMMRGQPGAKGVEGIWRCHSLEEYQSTGCQDGSQELSGEGCFSITPIRHTDKYQESLKIKLTTAWPSVFLTSVQVNTKNTIQVKKNRATRKKKNTQSSKRKN